MSTEVIEAIFKASGAEDFKEAFRGAESAVQEFEQVGKNIGDVGKGMSKWVTGPIVAAGTGLFGLANSTANYADELYDLSKQTGISAEGLQELNYWANQNGISQSGLERATGRLNQRIGLAAQGNAKYADGFAALGVSIQDTEGNMRSTEDIMRDTIVSLSEIEDSSLQSAMASEIFGTRLSRELMPALSDGAMSIDDAAAAAREFSGFMTEDAVIAADEFAQEIEDLKLEFLGLARDVGQDVIPLFQDTIFPLIQNTLIPAFRQFVEWISNLIDRFNNLSPGMQQSIIIFLALAAAAGPVLVVLGMLIQSVSNVIGVFLKMPAALTGVTASMLGWIAIVALVVAAVVHLWQTNEDFRNNIITIWENIKTVIMMVWEAIQPGAMAFISILMVFIGVLAEVIAWVAGVVASFTDWIVSFLETHSWIMQLIQVLGIIVGVIAGVIAVVAVVVKIFTAVVAVVKVVAAIFMFFTSPVGIVIAIIVALIGVITWLGEKFEWIGNIIDTVSGWVSNAWNGFLNILGFGTKEAADEAGESIEGLSESAGESTSEMAETTSENVSGMQNDITSSFDAMNLEGTQSMDMMSSDVLDSMGAMSDGSVDEVSGMSSDVSGYLEDLENSGNIDMSNLNIGVTDEMSDMSSTSISEIDELASQGSKGFDGLESDLTKSAAGMESSVEDSFSSMSSTVESELSNIENAASSSLDGLSKSFETSMKTAETTITNGMKSLVDTTRSTTIDMAKFTIIGMDSVNTAFSSGMSQNLRTVRMTGNRIVTQFRSLQSQLRSSGIQAMNGLRSGLNTGSGGVMNTARNIANRVASTINRALDIRSPSRVLERSGEDSGEGFEIGLWNMVRQVIKASEALAHAAIPNIDPGKIASQIGSIHRRVQQQMTYDYHNELNVNKQSAYINLNLGGRNYEAFVEDITTSQERTAQLNSAFR